AALQERGGQRGPPAFAARKNAYRFVEVGVTKAEAMQRRFYLRLMLVAAQRFEAMLQIAIALELVLGQNFAALQPRMNGFDRGADLFDFVRALYPFEERLV